jgi:N-acetyl-1-D-myo-inositol-2-amino-2-deoxy-alpha-D-glucopyranoside deacetylase
LLLVHAHPDDEAIATGATMAKYVDEGALVTLVTCTLGEEGEVVVPELAHLAADKDNALGPRRIDELAASMKTLGVTDHRYLGEPGKYRDSGMIDTPTNENPRSFWKADLDEATRDLVAVVREVKPQVFVTYDENGAYGHPDHIRAHDVAVAAFDKAGDASYAPDLGEPWRPTKLYYTAVPKSLMQAGLDALKAQGKDFFDGVESADDIPFAVSDDVITTEIDARAYLGAKRESLVAHVSQIAPDDPLFAFFETGEEGISFAREHYILAKGPRGPGSGDYNWESDLFAGLDV